MNVLVWYKRDLRVHDHPALSLAAGLGAVLPVYIVEPGLWAEPDASARQWEFVAESLDALREELAGIGAPLVVRVGDAVAVLQRLCQRHRVAQIVSHEETGNLWTIARDRRVAAWARGAGIDLTELSRSGVDRRQSSRDAWADRRDDFIALPALPVPALRAVEGLEPGLIPTSRALKLAPDPCLHRQLGGRARGLELIESFLSRRAEPYRTAMSSPLAAERACSRLSPHFAYGSLSVREVVQATAARQSKRPGGRWGGSLASFQSRLAWRDNTIQKLEDQPSIETGGLHSIPVSRLRETDAARLTAWQNGETGLPFLDASLRYLRATGWLNFRMRAMVASVATYHFGLDGQDTGLHLARMFTDYEPGIHWPQVQMHSGTTAIKTLRIHNPVKQGQEQDPTGAFTRAWLPELAAVPDVFLQEPWRWPEAQRIRGRRYPEPIIDIESSVRTARGRVLQARRATGIAEAASAISDRQASRSAPQVAKTRPPPAQNQMSFTF